MEETCTSSSSCAGSALVTLLSAELSDDGLTDSGVSDTVLKAWNTFLLQIWLLSDGAPEHGDKRERLSPSEGPYQEGRKYIRDVIKTQLLLRASASRKFAPRHLSKRPCLRGRRRRFWDADENAGCAGVETSADNFNEECYL